MTVKVLAKEEALTATGKDLGRATAVRLVNIVTTPTKVTITDESGVTVGEITLAASEGLTLQKSPEQKLSADPDSVVAVKVAHTN